MRALKRLSYANVMSTLAVFAVLGGGTAFAATQLAKNSVGTKQLKSNAVTTAKIKKEAVTAAKIKNGAITGAKVNLGSLGTVPNAAHAENADAVGGHTVNKIFAKIAKGSSQTIATFGVYKMEASCDALGNPDITLSTTATDTEFAAMGNGTNIGGENVFYEREQKAGSVSLNEVNERGTTTFTAAQSGGAVTTGTITYDDSSTFNSEATCAVFGNYVS